MKKKKKSFFNTILQTLKVIFISGGCLLFLIIILALTPAPFYMYYHLGTDSNCLKNSFHPHYIVMLGGAGMPSQGNLMRLHYTAKYAQSNTEIVILHPKDSLCQKEMEKELIAKGIHSEKITFITEGSNTHSQILQLKNTKPELLHQSLLVITSPEYLKRTVKCFTKLGFTSVCGKGAFEATVDFDLSLLGKKLEGNEIVPLVESTNLRYTFWNYLKLEIDCFREYTALAYYKIKGWN
ncbi:MAG: YdcF family protein [Bacteroidales bacterium]|jgi:uncharacterized SAM-binding protein YcdF (DUF218 family)|nr:YdcF family protein [Bacteroidales bacterium]